MSGKVPLSYSVVLFFDDLEKFGRISVKFFISAVIVYTVPSEALMNFDHFVHFSGSKRDIIVFNKINR